MGNIDSLTQEITEAPMTRGLDNEFPVAAQSLTLDLARQQEGNFLQLFVVDRWSFLISLCGAWVGSKLLVV